MGNSPSRLTTTAPSRREPFDEEGKFPARTKTSLLEGGGTALAVPEGVLHKFRKIKTKESSILTF